MSKLISMPLGMRLLILVGALSALAQPLQGKTRAVGPKLEAQIAALKVKTAALVAPARAELDALSPQQRLAAAPAIWRVRGALTEFRDCARCPQMVVIPAGDFTMGSPPSALQAEAQHRVTIAAPFAVGKFAVTFEEWDDCVKGGGCTGYRPDGQGWGRGRHPAIDISWDLAKAYVEWLAAKTGKPYRLLTEAEWEYSARAGTTTKFSTGDTISPRLANYDGSPDGAGPSAANRQLSAQCLRPLRHGRQRHPMGGGLLARGLHGRSPHRRLGLGRGQLRGARAARRIMGGFRKRAALRRSHR